MTIHMVNRAMNLHQQSENWALTQGESAQIQDEEGLLVKHWPTILCSNACGALSPGVKVLSHEVLMSLMFRLWIAF